MLMFLWVVFAASLTGAGLVGIERYDRTLKARKLRELGRIRVAKLEIDRVDADERVAAQQETEAMKAKINASNPAGFLHP